MGPNPFVVRPTKASLSAGWIAGISIFSVVITAVIIYFTVKKCKESRNGLGASAQIYDTNPVADQEAFLRNNAQPSI